MRPKLPLSAAAERLRQRPGHPRKGESEDITGTPDAKSCMNCGVEKQALAQKASVAADGDTWGSDTSRCDRLVPLKAGKE